MTSPVANSIISVAGSTLEINGVEITFKAKGDFIKIDPTGDLADIVYGGDGQSYSAIFDVEGLKYSGLIRVFAYQNGGDSYLLGLAQQQMNAMRGNGKAQFLSGSLSIPVGDSSVKSYTLNGILFKKAPPVPPLNQNNSDESVIREYEIVIGSVVEN